MKKYLKELKRNRDFKATEIVKNSLISAGIDVMQLNKNLLRDISLIQNRTRGPLFELMSEIIIGSAISANKCEKQTVFPTPYGKRRIDLFISEQGIAIEVKSGYVRIKGFIKMQIAKDKYILSHESRVGRMIWICFRGASNPLIALLQQNGIEYWDIESDKLDSQSEFIERTASALHLEQ